MELYGFFFFFSVLFFKSENFKSAINISGRERGIDFHELFFQSAKPAISNVYWVTKHERVSFRLLFRRFFEPLLSSLRSPTYFSNGLPHESHHCCCTDVTRYSLARSVVFFFFLPRDRRRRAGPPYTRLFLAPSTFDIVLTTCD